MAIANYYPNMGWLFKKYSLKSYIYPNMGNREGLYLKSCTFFGHSDCCEPIKPLLKNILINLVENDVTTFYVGNNGLYDSNVIAVLKELKEIYSHISFFVVLAYLPNKKENIQPYKTVYPLGIELVPPKFAISYRNKWMVEISDYVVTYIKKTARRRGTVL